MKTQLSRILSTLSLLLLSTHVTQAQSSAPQTNTCRVTASLSSTEYLDQSIDLLDRGSQIGASDLIEEALTHYPKDPTLLFARGVLNRSRWQKSEAATFFFKVRRLAPDSALALAAKLSLEQDMQSTTERLDQLISLSDDHPNDVYLLWLSAIQCREHDAGKKGKIQYEKFLRKFSGGPVMGHHTYANILTEYLHDYSRALKHRRIAVKIEPKGWSYQGLANTLRNMKRYNDACEAWEKALELDPNSTTYLQQWGDTLCKMKLYDEACKKYCQQLSLSPRDGHAVFDIAYCQMKLHQHDRILQLYTKAYDLGHAPAAFWVAICYRKGWGTKVNYSKALLWYERSANIGDSRAQYYVGNSYALGLGNPQNWKEAIIWFEKSAKQNNHQAINALIKCYSEGLGTSVDRNRVRELRRRL